VLPLFWLCCWVWLWDGRSYARAPLRPACALSLDDTCISHAAISATYSARFTALDCLIFCGVLSPELIAHAPRMACLHLKSFEQWIESDWVDRMAELH